MEYHIYSPSYKRSKTCKTHKLFKSDRFSYVINESDYNQYSKLNVDLKVIPDGVCKNIVQTRNWILDNADSNRIIQVDDDISNFYAIENCKKINLNPDDLNNLIISGFNIIDDLNIKLWGLNLIPDPKAYRTLNPISFKSPILGPFTATSNINIRYDENLTLKEDYDFFLNIMKTYGKSLRFNFISYECDHQNLDGGCSEYRTPDFEKNQMELIKSKWGNEIIKSRDTSINPKIYI